MKQLPLKLDVAPKKQRDSDNGHYCAAISCTLSIPKGVVMCSSHWAMVPELLRNEVLSQWQSNNTNSLDYLNPKIEAVEIVHRRERPDLYEDVGQN